MKKFKEKRYYIDMFNTDVVWLYGKRFDDIKSHVKKKYNATIEDMPDFADGGMFDISDSKTYRMLIVTEKKDLVIFTHELVHVTQNIMDHRNLLYSGEWYAYFLNNLVEKLYK